MHGAVFDFNGRLGVNVVAAAASAAGSPFTAWVLAAKTRKHHLFLRNKDFNKNHVNGKKQHDPIIAKANSTICRSGFTASAEDAGFWVLMYR
ncbi:MAG: hypothetical protein R2860_17490 [Desulfobacterales bacterium]